MYTIPDSYMKPFLVVHCDECGSEHAPIRPCLEDERDG